MPAKYDVNDTKRYQNPSLGLSIWGPLVPANDCRTCLYTLSGLQIIGGLYLFWRPGKKPGRNVWLNRTIRLGGILSGTYLMALAGVELGRSQLRSDAWVEDAKIARRRAIEAGKSPSLWFGPEGYQAVSMKEWIQRLEGSIKRAEAAGSRVEIIRGTYEEIRQKNRAIAWDILHDLQTQDLERLVREDNEVQERKQVSIEPGTGASNGASNGTGAGVLESIRSKFNARSILSHFGLIEPEASSGDADEFPEWNVLEPWDRLSDETDIIIRLLPYSGAAQDEHHRRASEEASGSEEE